MGWASYRLQLGPVTTVVTMPHGVMALGPNQGGQLLGEPVEQFNRPLTITVGNTDTDVAGIRRETLRLWTREGPEGPWASLGEPVQVMSGALAFTTTHFSEFALYGEAMHKVYLLLVRC